MLEICCSFFKSKLKSKQNPTATNNKKHTHKRSFSSLVSLIACRGEKLAVRKHRVTSEKLELSGEKGSRRKVTLLQQPQSADSELLSPSQLFNFSFSSKISLFPLLQGICDWMDTFGLALKDCLPGKLHCVFLPTNLSWSCLFLTLRWWAP